ncbi:hypothetical protein I302_106393 [Kwoniella bestiolae CBS 10118]|uniref:Xylanolytic transcriptional activator regulatory domain-containing protein n=1 Tax=Kwoniella bestiolae CBS 10118 TaxID=1296100 RepID=A0AAJ8MB78_9TREE
MISRACLSCKRASLGVSGEADRAGQQLPETLSLGKKQSSGLYVVASPLVRAFNLDHDDVPVPTWTISVASASGGAPVSNSKKDHDNGFRPPASSTSDDIEPSEGNRRIKRIRTRTACSECRTRKIRHDSDDDQSPHMVPSSGDHRTLVSGQGLEPRYFGTTSIPSILASVTLQPSMLPPGSLHFHSGTRPGSLEKGGPDRIHFTSVQSGQHSVLIAPDEGETISRTTGNSGDRSASLRARRSSTEERVASHFLSESVLESLVALYRMRIVPVHPVISISETASLFAWIRKPNLDSTPPTPLPRILRLIICAVPAQWRAVPKDIRQSLRVTISSQLEDPKASTCLRASSLGNLQTLSVLAMSADLLPSSKYENWINTGTTIRMAQEIGLHRELPSDAVPLGQRNRRKRVWAACQIMDAWHAVSTGLPSAIDPSDCDAGPPFAFPDHVREHETEELEPCFETHVHIWRLSLILRRIMKAVCSPSGLGSTSDIVLYQLDRDLTEWEMTLPSDDEAPSFEIFDSGNTNMIKVLFTCVEGIFVHAFLTNTRPIPPHINFRPGASQWSRLLHRSGEAIEWISKNGMFYLDVWHIVIHALVICFVLQFHDYISTGNPNRLERLRLANKIIQAWAKPSEGEPPRDRGWLASQVKSLVDNLESSRTPFTHQVDLALLDDLQQAITTSPAVTTQLPPSQQSLTLQTDSDDLQAIGQNTSFNLSEDPLLFEDQPGALDEERIAQILGIFESATSGPSNLF